MPEISRSDGRPAEPLPYKGWKAKMEQLCFRLGFKKLGRFFGRWDEKGLG